MQKSIEQESTEEIKHLFDMSPSSSPKKITFEQNFKISQDLAKHSNKNALNIINNEQ